MSNYSKYHHRINSDPARIHDWHVRHRSLSLAARMHANIQIPSSPTQPDMADRNTGFPEPLSPGTASPQFSFAELRCAALFKPPIADLPQTATPPCDIPTPTLLPMPASKRTTSTWPEPICGGTLFCASGTPHVMARSPSTPAM